MPAGDINPLEIITEMRRYVVMEESQARKSEQHVWQCRKYGAHGNTARLIGLN